MADNEIRGTENSRSAPQLKSCPFCDAEVDVWSDDKRTWGLVRHKDGCFFPNFRNHEIPEYEFDAWNTRVADELTCIENCVARVVGE